MMKINHHGEAYSTEPTECNEIGLGEPELCTLGEIDWSSIPNPCAEILLEKKCTAMT